MPDPGTSPTRIDPRGPRFAATLTTLVPRRRNYGRLSREAGDQLGRFLRTLDVGGVADVGQGLRARAGEGGVDLLSRISVAELVVGSEDRE